MPADVTYTVTNPQARREAVGPMIREIAAKIAAAAAAATPVQTGALAGSYSLAAGRDPGTTLIRSSGVPHGLYIEYGTRHIRAFAPLGRALASGR